MNILACSRNIRQFLLNGLKIISFGGKFCPIKNDMINIYDRYDKIKENNLTV